MKVRPIILVASILLLAIMMTATIASAQTAGAKSAMPSINCKECHTCDVPTVREPCLKSCPRTQMVHRATQHALGDAPDSMLLDDLADLYQPVHFQSQAARRDGSNGQGLCHLPPLQSPGARSRHAKIATPCRPNRPTCASRTSKARIIASVWPATGSGATILSASSATSRRREGSSTTPRTTRPTSWASPTR